LAKILVLSLVLAASCGLADVEPPREAQEERPTAIFTGFRREEVTKGMVSFYAEAERAEYYQDQKLIIVYNLRFEERGEDGKEIVSEGEAQKAVYHEDTGDAEFSGYVRLASKAEDASFETSNLKYFSATQTLEGGPDTPVIARVGQRLFMKGQGFFANIGESAFTFANGTEGTLKTSGSLGRQ
jgi:LPS export ABC transporter protein LptC